MRALRERNEYVHRDRYTICIHIYMYICTVVVVLSEKRRPCTAQACAVILTLLVNCYVRPGQQYCLNGRTELCSLVRDMFSFLAFSKVWLTLTHTRTHARHREPTKQMTHPTRADKIAPQTLPPGGEEIFSADAIYTVTVLGHRNELRGCMSACKSSRHLPAESETSICAN